jgi:hypothetical protein
MLWLHDETDSKNDSEPPDEKNMMGDDEDSEEVREKGVRQCGHKMEFTNINSDHAEG